MQTQTNINTKKTAKRRNRNKRRRKLRQQRKIQDTNGKNFVGNSKRQKQKQLEPQQQSEKWEALCLETFQRLTTWQCEAELNFWKARTEYLQKENKELKQQLEAMKKEADERFTEEHDGVDPGYLDFIAITQRHREELKRARACISESSTGVD